MEIQVDCQLLYERRIAGRARLLESVGYERSEHLQFAHARADGDPDRDGARGDNHPWHLRETSSPCKCAGDGHSEHDDPLDIARERLCVVFAGEESLAIGGRGDALAGEQHAVDRLVGEPGDELHERVSCLPGVDARTLPRRGDTVAREA